MQITIEIGDALKTEADGLIFAKRCVRQQFAKAVVELWREPFCCPIASCDRAVNNGESPLVFSGKPL